MKDHNLDPKESGAHDPYHVLFHQLTGVSSQCLWLKSPANVWCKTAQLEINAIMKQKEGVPWAQKATLHDQIVRDMFAVLSNKEKEEWAEQAKEEHEEALKTWKHETEGSLSMTPEDQQR